MIGWLVLDNGTGTFGSSDGHRIEWTLEGIGGSMGEENIWEHNSGYMKGNM